MKSITIQMSEDDLKMLRAYLVVSLDRGVIHQDTWGIVSSAINQLDKQLYPHCAETFLKS